MSSEEEEHLRDQPVTIGEVILGGLGLVVLLALFALFSGAVFWIFLLQGACGLGPC